MIRIAHVVNSLSATTHVITRVGMHDRTSFEPHLVSFYDQKVERDRFNLPSDIKILALGGLQPAGRLRELARYVRSEGIQVFHTYHGRSSFWTSWVSRFLGVPILFEDAATHSSYSLGTRTLLMATLFLCDVILCPSRAVQDSYSRVERWLVRPERLRIIPYGISVARMRQLEVDRTRELLRYGVDPSRFVFIHTGRMVPVKRQDFLIRLFAEMARLSPRVHLLMVGDGPLRRHLERIVKEASLDTRVTFTGMLLHDAVYRLLRASDAFIMTSRSEGLSISLLEALACGLPAVLTENASFRETMVGGKGAIFLAEGESVREMAARVVRELVEDTKNYQRLSLEARELAHTFYDGDRWIRNLENLYRELARRVSPTGNTAARRTR
jgi:glycosyltransferase involved in cell wall biosynthesis